MGGDNPQKVQAKNLPGESHLAHPSETLQGFSHDAAHRCLLEDSQHYQKHLRETRLNHQFAHDMQVHTDSPFKHSGEAMHNRTRLEDVARQKLTIPQMSTLEHDISVFEKKAAANQLPSEKIAQFYDATGNLLRGKSQRYSPSQKNDLALELVHHAAYPESVNQGHLAGTCNVSTVEYRLLVREPQAVAKMTEQISSDCTFTTAGGTTLLPNWHSIKPDAKDTDRDMFDRMVQTTLVNCYWENHKGYPDDPRTFRYEHLQNLAGVKGNDKDRIRTWEDDGPSRKFYTEGGKEGGKEIDDPYLGTADLRQIYNRASGANDEAFAIENSDREKTGQKYTENPECIQIHSQSDLHKVFSEANEKHQFPLEITVHTGNSPFEAQTIRNSAAAAGNPASFGWHGVSVASYDERTQTAKIHNSWGKSMDVTIGLAELYKATQVPDKYKGYSAN